MAVQFDQHLAKVLALAEPLPTVTLGLLECLGLPVARDVTALLPVPTFTNSAMDGYAVRSADVASAPVRLEVTADIPAGTSPGLRVRPGQAHRIMTGAPLPVGADAVVPVELTDQRAGAHPLPRHVTIHQPEPAGANVRTEGEDVSVGATVIEAGVIADAAVLAAAAAVGHSELLVRPRPRVAIFATGSELVAPGDALAPGQIPDSNSILLAGLVREHGGEAVIVGSVADDCTELRQRLTRSALDVDLVLTAGGISAGAYEVVKQACEGWDIEFEVVQMRPGAPQGCGWLPGGPDRRVPLVAVPGNPVAVFVSFHVFVRPLLTLMSGGDPESVPGTVAAISNGGLRSRVDKRQFTPVLVTLDDEQGGLTTLSLPGGTGSHRIATLHQANGLAVIAEELAEIAPGEAVPVIPVGPDWRN